MRGHAVKILSMSNPGGNTAAEKLATAEARTARFRAVLSKWAGFLGFVLARLRRRSEKRLRLCENLALGDRRFVAVVQYEQTRFLLGGTASSLVVLARLGEAAGEVMEEKPGFHDDAQPQAGMQVETHAAASPVATKASVTRTNLKDQL